MDAVDPLYVDVYLYYTLHTHVQLWSCQAAARLASNCLCRVLSKDLITVILVHAKRLAPSPEQAPTYTWTCPLLKTAAAAALSSSPSPWWLLWQLCLGRRRNQRETRARVAPQAGSTVAFGNLWRLSGQLDR